VANAVRAEVKVRNGSDPQFELGVALSKLKKKLKESNVLLDYLDHCSYRRPAVRRKEKSLRAAARLRAEQRRERRRSKFL
jgi:ribosomal protein S21